MSLAGPLLPPERRSASRPLQAFRAGNKRQAVPTSALSGSQIVRRTIKDRSSWNFTGVPRTASVTLAICTSALSRKGVRSALFCVWPRG
jgi:hypothetical protein